MKIIIFCILYISKGVLLKVFQLLAAEIKINSVLPLNSLFLPDVSLYKGANKDLIELRGGRQGSASFTLTLIKRRSSCDKPNDFRGQEGDLNM